MLPLAEGPHFLADLAVVQQDWDEMLSQSLRSLLFCFAEERTWFTEVEETGIIGVCLSSVPSIEVSSSTGLSTFSPNSFTELGFKEVEYSTGHLNPLLSKI